MTQAAELIQGDRKISIKMVTRELSMTLIIKASNYVN